MDMRSMRHFIRDLLPQAFERMLDDCPGRRWLAKSGHKIAACLAELAHLTASKLKERMADLPGTAAAEEHNIDLTCLIGALIISWDEKGDVYQEPCCMAEFGRHPTDHRRRAWAAMPDPASPRHADQGSLEDDFSSMSPESMDGPINRWFFGLLNMFGEVGGFQCIFQVTCSPLSYDLPAICMLC